MTPLEWLELNYGMILTVLVLLVIIFNKKIRSFFPNKSKPKQEETEIPFIDPTMPETLAGLEESNLFNDLQKKDTLSMFKQQKAVAEKYIKSIKEEGKKLIGEEKKAAFEYQQTRNNFNLGRQQLGVKYNIWVNKLNTLDNMILQQIRMEEELKKLKGGENESNKS